MLHKIECKPKLLNYIKSKKFQVDCINYKYEVASFIFSDED